MAIYVLIHFCLQVVEASTEKLPMNTKPFLYQAVKMLFNTIKLDILTKESVGIDSHL